MNKTILEKYQPKKVQDLKLPARILTFIENNSDRVGYKLLFYGPPGVGKTSTALLMNMDKSKYDVLYISGSNDFNVQTLREKIYPFASNYSALNKQKTVIIDECENIADKLQDAFKILLDNAKKVNFIFITNEVEKVNSAILSRCAQIEYNFQENELQEQKNNYVALLVNIIQQENIKFTNEGVFELFIKNFPDIRHSLVTIQQLIDSNQDITVENVRNASEVGVQNVELYELIESQLDAQKFYEGSTVYKGKEKECFSSLAEPYFRYLNSKGKFEQTLKAAVIVAKYSNMYHNSTSKFGIFFAMLTELRTLFR